MPVTRSETARPEQDRAPAVAAHGVRVVLGGQPVLHDVDLEVAPGATVALMGGNGSGKSTLVRAVLGLAPTVAGRIELFGDPLARFRGWNRIGYVPQRSVLAFGGAKVGEVVASGRLGHRRPFVPSRRADREAVRRALETVRLEHRRSEVLTTLSGGQQQRVLIARALATEPQLLVLDEPVAGVDLEQQQVLADVFATLVERGTSILVVLHEAGPIAGLVDTAVVLRDGRVVHCGPLPEYLDHTGHTGHELDQGHDHVRDPDGFDRELTGPDHHDLPWIADPDRRGSGGLR